ncbi:hypothetical protein NW755_014342 [Fusarium falciforme]|uniref:Metallo-beta-lactamase domain-containing protein n=1 Tax=Fusarium falciforme TaxID=195108 RepID=A0A9W8QSW2_9HYPO|nr:hypothetical protein NW755_014342 [Fusarium falciforme]
MAPEGFRSSLSITHIGTATAVLEVDGINLLTDPFFSPAGTSWDMGGGNGLQISETPALGLEHLPPIDAILLSHEDHPDNLDEFGRQLLNARRVLTTMDGAANLSPRPAITGMKPWDTTSLQLGGKTFQVTATPCQHLPGGECIGFVVTTEEFGVSADGLPNAIYFTGDTVYINELTKIPEKFHIVAAIMNIGAAFAKLPDGPLQITMGGAQASRLFRDIKADYLVPMHYESWNHFTEHGKELAKVFSDEGISSKVCWLEPGKSVKIL